MNVSRLWKEHAGSFVTRAPCCRGELFTEREHSTGWIISLTSLDVKCKRFGKLSNSDWLNSLVDVLLFSSLFNYILPPFNPFRFPLPRSLKFSTITEIDVGCQTMVLVQFQCSSHVRLEKYSPQRPR